MTKANGYFNSTGYFFKSPSIEFGGSTPRNMEYDDLQHRYLVLAALLHNLRDQKLSITTIYGDCRVIDDMCGAPTLGPWYDKTRGIIRRVMVPEIPGIVLFKKASTAEVDYTVNAGLQHLGILDQSIHQRFKDQHRAAIDRHADAMSSKASRLKRRWFYGQPSE